MVKEMAKGMVTGMAMEMEETEMEKPYLLIGSPPCRAFNTLFASNISRMDPAQVKSIVREGVRHVLFCIELYTCTYF